MFCLRWNEIVTSSRQKKLLKAVKWNKIFASNDTNTSFENLHGRLSRFRVRTAFVPFYFIFFKSLDKIGPIYQIALNSFSEYKSSGCFGINQIITNVSWLSAGRHEFSRPRDPVFEIKEKLERDP